MDRLIGNSDGVGRCLPTTAEQVDGFGFGHCVVLSHEDQTAVNHSLTPGATMFHVKRLSVELVSNYGQRLENAIRLAKSNPKALAAELGISVQAVYKVVRGESKALTATNSVRAARFLLVDHNWLVSGVGEPRPAAPNPEMEAELLLLFRTVLPEERMQVLTQLRERVEQISRIERHMQERFKFSSYAPNAKVEKTIKPAPPAPQVKRTKKAK